MNSIQLAKGLGWFSLGLGVLEMAAPGRMARGLGLPVPPALVGLFGMREVIAGLAVLTYPGSPGPVWARVGGDVLDLAVLALHRGGHQRQQRAMLATAAVLGVTALDVLCAAALTQRRRQSEQTARRTRITHSARHQAGWTTTG